MAEVDESLQKAFQGLARLESSLGHCKKLAQNRDVEILRLRAENERLKAENTRLRNQAPHKKASDNFEGLAEELKEIAEEIRHFPSPKAVLDEFRDLLGFRKKK